MKTDKVRVFKTDRELRQFHAGRNYERKEQRKKLAELKKRIKEQGIFEIQSSYYNLKKISPQKMWLCADLDSEQKKNLIKIIDEVFGK